MGKEAIWPMLSPRDKDQQHSVISNFLQQKLDASRAQVILLQQQDHQRTKIPIESHFTEPIREHRPQSFKLEINKYRGFEEVFLLRCFVDVYGAIEARCIGDERMQSHLLIRTWQGTPGIGP